MKVKPHFEPNLVITEVRLPKSGEWMPLVRNWSLLFIKSGISYWQHPDGAQAQELPPASVVVLTGQARGRLRASQLSEVVVSYFCVEPGKLSGVLSLNEQIFLRKAAGRENPPVRVLSPDSPISERFKNLCANAGGGGLSLRLQLLQLFIDLFKGGLADSQAEPPAESDGRTRLRQLLKQLAASEFVELSLSDLAPKLRCSRRHLSRLFRLEMGASFREKQTELRLAKACELLATSKAKVVDVALTSGYQSNSLFNLMFKKHFGMSPGEWRQRQRETAPRRRRIQHDSNRLYSAFAQNAG